LRAWIDDCPNSLYSALTFQGGASWRQALLADLGRSKARAIIDPLSDDDLGALMTNLGGHDIETVIDTLRAEADGDQPTCFIAYTIKGMGLPFAGHKDNHAGLMTKEQMEGSAPPMGIRPGHEWDLFEGLMPATTCATSCGVPFATPLTRKDARSARLMGRCRQRSWESGGRAGCPLRPASATSLPRSDAARVN
jgi:pyruvate dehydrogenase E1 component